MNTLLQDIRCALRMLALALIAFPLLAARAQDPSSPRALIEGGHWKRVSALAQQLSQTKPDDPETLYLMAEAKQAFGDDAGALPLAQKAVSLDENNAAYHFGLAEIYGDMAQHAGMFKQMGLARSFRSEAEKAAALDKRNTDVRLDLLDFYLHAPGIIGGGKDKANAEAAEIAQISAAQGFLAQAQIAGHDKDSAKQLAFYEKAVQANPSDYNAAIALASRYSDDSLRRYDDAERLCRTALKLAPDRIAAYTILAIMYAQQGKLSELDQLLTSETKNDSDNAGAHYQAGRILLTKGDALQRAEQISGFIFRSSPKQAIRRWPLRTGGWARSWRRRIASRRRSRS